jgi:hypothetical protein
VRRNQGVVASPKGITEKVVVLSRVINNWANPNSTEEVRGGSGRSNQLTTSSKGIGCCGELTEEVIAAFNLLADDVVERTFDTSVPDPVQGPEAGVFERSSETVLVVEGRHGSRRAGLTNSTQF